MKIGNRVLAGTALITCTWDGSEGKWNDGNRWSCGPAPGLGETAVISGGILRVTFPYFRRPPG